MDIIVGGKDVIRLDDPLPVPVPGNELSRLMNFFVRSDPPSQFASEILHSDVGGGHHSEMSPV